MASKINKTYSGSISGILDIRDDGIYIEVPEIDTPISLADFFSEFNDKDVTIRIGNKVEY